MSGRNMYRVTEEDFAKAKADAAADLASADSEDARWGVLERALAESEAIGRDEAEGLVDKRELAGMRAALKVEELRPLVCPDVSDKEWRKAKSWGRPLAWRMAALRRVTAH